MSTLGEDIRAQKRLADLLSGDLARSATNLRTTITATHWSSGSADRCRNVLTDFANTLDAYADDASSFGTDIWLHASCVESHETSITAAVTAPYEVTKKALAKVGDALHRDEREGPFDYSYHGDWRG